MIWAHQVLIPYTQPLTSSFPTLNLLHRINANDKRWYNSSGAPTLHTTSHIGKGEAWYVVSCPWLGTHLVLLTMKEHYGEKKICCDNEGTILTFSRKYKRVSAMVDATSPTSNSREVQTPPAHPTCQSASRRYLWLPNVRPWGDPSDTSKATCKKCMAQEDGAEVNNLQSSYGICGSLDLDRRGKADDGYCQGAKIPHR